MNHEITDKVEALLDECSTFYSPDVERFYSREQTEAIIHAALLGYASRRDSTAAAYGANQLFEALGLEDWTFKKTAQSE